MTPRNRRIMMDWLEGRGTTEIGQRHSLTSQQIRNIMKLPEIEREIDAMAASEWGKQFTNKIGLAAERALDVMYQVMEGEIKSELIYKAAKDLLDRHPTQRVREVGKAIGEGLGDEIITRLARIRAERNEPKEIVVQ